jgi:hypothetical protein
MMTGPELPQTTTPKSAVVVWANFVMLVILGTAVLAWIHRYTESFGMIGGLLGLGGVLAWAAFLTNVVGRDTKARMQAGFEGLVLGRERGWLVMVALLGVLFLVAGRFGAVRLDSRGDPTPRLAWATPAATPSEPVEGGTPLPGGGRVNLLVGVPPFGSGTFRVKVRGLPALVTSVSAFERRTFAVPEAFLQRPVLLLRPTLVESTSLRNNPLPLVISRDGTEWKIDRYAGQAVWLGCESDVGIPARVLDDWRFDLARANQQPSAIAIWTPPVSLADAVDFAPGDELEFRVGSAASPRVKVVATVRRSEGAFDFPQEVALEGVQ